MDNSSEEIFEKVRFPHLGNLLAICLSALIVVSLAPAWAGADEAADEESDASKQTYQVHDEVFVEDELPDIPTSNTVAAKLPLSLLETPASVTVIPASVFDDQGAFVMSDALRNVSGLNVQTFNGVFDFFVLRGLDSVSSGLIQTDGVPEPEATFYQLYNVERVEVLKGPSAFLYGDSPLVGTVNLVRKQPQSGQFSTLSFSGGSFGTFEGAVDTNAASADGRLSFRLNGLWQQSDGFRDDKESDNLAINPALTWRPSDNTSINLNLEYVETEYRTDTGLPILFSGDVVDVPRERSYQSPFDISDQELGRFQLDIEHRISDRLTVRNKTYYRSLDWLSSGTLFGGAFPDGTGSLSLSRFLSSLDNEQTFIGNQFEVLWRVETGSITHNLLAGVELARRSDEFEFNVFALPNIDVFNPMETARDPLFPLPGQATSADADNDVLAPYLIDQIIFSDKVQVLVGARYDSIDFENQVSGVKRDNSELSPMVGVVIQPTAGLTLYANAGEAFALPSTFVVDDERQPEESQQVELGVKKTFAEGKVETSLALFRIDRENIAIPDDFGLARQVGDQRSEGVELEVAASPRKGMDARFSYAYTDSELTEFTESVQVALFPPVFFTFDRSGNTSPFAPEHLINFWVSQRFSNGFGFGGGGRYVSSQFIAEDNAFEIDDYVTLDAAVFYDLGAWRLQLNLRNLTDEEYFTRGFGGSSVIPAPGFGAYGGIQYRF